MGQRFIHHTNNIIDVAPRTLPRVWKATNTSGLDMATTAELKAIGWLSVIDIDPPFDSATQIRTGPAGGQIGDAVPAGANDVTVEFTVRNKTVQEFDDEKDAITNIILNEPGLKALILAMNDGSFVPDSGYTNAQLKTIIKAKL